MSCGIVTGVPGSSYGPGGQAQAASPTGTVSLSSMPSAAALAAARTIRRSASNHVPCASSRHATGTATSPLSWVLPATPEYSVEVNGHAAIP